MIEYVPTCPGCDAPMLGTIHVADPEKVTLEGNRVRCPSCGEVQLLGADAEWTKIA